MSKNQKHTTTKTTNPDGSVKVTRGYPQTGGKGHRRSTTTHPDGSRSADHTIDQNTGRGYNHDTDTKTKKGNRNPQPNGTFGGWLDNILNPNKK